MGDAKRTNVQSWRAWLTIGERWEIRAILLSWPVKSKDAKARTRAIECVDEARFEQPYGQSAEESAAWLAAFNAELRTTQRDPTAVTSENASVILDVIDAVMDDDRGEEQQGKSKATSKGGDPRIVWRLRHAIAALEAVRRGESVAGVAEPVTVAPPNGAEESIAS